MVNMMERRDFYGGKVSEERAAPIPPESPGASHSPQRPGETPDRSDIPGEFVAVSPPIEGVPLRPLTEYGTAQEISNLMPAPTEAAEPSDFEQPPASFQENRKAYPWQLPPVRPTSVFALDQGVAEQPPALPGAEAAAIAEASSVEG
jgi:hypothetical protein